MNKFIDFFFSNKTYFTLISILISVFIVKYIKSRMSLETAGEENTVEEKNYSSVEEVPEEDKEKAEKVKAEANVLFKNKSYDKAIEKYTEAIKLNPFVPVYYSNRAFAYIKEESYGYALADANKCIELDSKFVKGYYRRAIAHMALLNLKEALKDLRAVCKAAPNDIDARRQLKACEKEYKLREFEKAIKVDEVIKTVEQILGNPDDIVVPDTYDGPRFDDEITEDYVNQLIEYQKEQKVLHKKYVYKTVINARKYFEKKESLNNITIPENGRITVCGDVHGQYYDLLHIFETNGKPSPTNMYLFNGDFVDRGSFSLEVIMLLLSYVLLYPDSFFLNRGNHETIDMNKVYGFEGECTSKFTSNLFKGFIELFNSLPLAYTIENKIFIVHGGLSEDGVTLDDIRKIDRFRQPGQGGLMSDLLWTDPQPAKGRGPSKRGVGFQFGPDVTEDFLKRNNLDLLIRSHEVKQNGYEIEHNGKCVTVFSAPNYCDQMGNLGAFINFDKSLVPKYNTFKASDHPKIPAMKYAKSFFGF